MDFSNYEEIPFSIINAPCTKASNGNLYPVYPQPMDIDGVGFFRMCVQDEWIKRMCLEGKNTRCALAGDVVVETLKKALRAARQQTDKAVHLASRVDLLGTSTKKQLKGKHQHRDLRRS